MTRGTLDLSKAKNVKEISEYRLKMYDYLISNSLEPGDIIVLASGLLGQVGDEYIDNGGDRRVFRRLMEKILKDSIFTFDKHYPT